MELGIGLPNTVPGTTGDQLTDWARAAEDAGFSSLGTIDRIVFPNYEPVVALSAAAAVTERIKLVTDVMLGPLRVNPAVIAKQFLSLDALAGGDRAVLGIGVGGREDDYAISGMDMSGRGKWLDGALARIRDIWNGDGELGSKVGPRPSGKGPSLMVGGYVQKAFERAAKYGDGWTQGGSGASQFGADLSISMTPGRRPAATASPAPWRWPTSASGLTPRRTSRPTSATTTPGSVTRLSRESSPPRPRTPTASRRS